MAQVLERNGYETSCITANAWISDRLGLTRGFAHQDRSLRSEGGAGLGFSFIHPCGRWPASARAASAIRRCVPTGATACCGRASLKLVATSKAEHLLYDLASDPLARHELSAERPELLARMRTRLEEVRVSLDLPELDAPLGAGDAAPELDAATREQLRKLGYIE